MTSVDRGAGVATLGPYLARIWWDKDSTDDQQWIVEAPGGMRTRVVRVGFHGHGVLRTDLAGEDGYPRAVLEVVSGELTTE